MRQSGVVTPTASLPGVTAVAFLAAMFSLLTPAMASSDIIEYVAEYDGYYKGRRVARAEFKVRALSEGGYLFESSTRARGVLRLASPGTVIEQSRFSIDAGALISEGFVYEDGSRKGEDNYVVAFDEAAGEIRVDGPEVSLGLPYASDIHDRGGLQVALMRDLTACKAPGPYRGIDDDGISVYNYERLDDEVLDSELGPIATVRFQQQSEGSTRRTILALAPELGFLPVRIEQIRDGEVTSALALQSIDGIERSSSSCSGFR